MKTKSVKEIEGEIDEFLKSKHAYILAVMSDSDKFVTLVPGRQDRTYSRVCLGYCVLQNAVILSSRGLEEAMLVNGHFGAGKSLSTSQALRVFRRKFPNRSFMKDLRKGLQQLSPRGH